MVANKASENMKRSKIVHCDDSVQDELYDNDEVQG
jgi:hypothetical protein